ncbi:uncharacterized protein K02A2.6-like [Macrosteles quadrilineatus]|uniref:uncharacterized protein K02A2.6-like n=1 Tax=Macrosteles quadrilineatus TaxID=74068 RepID=UPI0023E31505|nr:uncharacterized protein K02A2.6-like [Macrosteles quadrilineatus]
MKSLARSFVFWPGMDSEIENMVKSCSVCQRTRKSASLAPLQPWAWPKHNWQRLHLDFASFEGKEFLILVDGHSKWIEVFYMPTTTARQTIEKLRHGFATFGLPTTIVTDGGPQFTSQEFNDFLSSNGIHHVLSPPYHPASNGLAERAVQTVKHALHRQLLHDAKYNQSRSLQHRIDSFLFSYRNTPHTITNLTPSEAVFKFKPRTQLSLLKPHLADQMLNKQESIVKSANAHRGKQRTFTLQDKVCVKTVRNEKINWQPGVITKVISPVTYLVKVDNRSRFVHADHLRVNLSKGEDGDSDSDILVQFPRELYQSPAEHRTSPAKQQGSPVKPKSPQGTRTSPMAKPIVSPNSTNQGSPATLRRSNRTIRAPRRLEM